MDALAFILIWSLGLVMGVALGIPISIIMILSLANPHIPVKELIHGKDKG